MINKDLLKQLIIEEKKKYKMNLVEQTPAAPAAPAGGTPVTAPTTTSTQQTVQQKLTPEAINALNRFIGGLESPKNTNSKDKQVAAELKTKLNLAAFGIK